MKKVISIVKKFIKRHPKKLVVVLLVCILAYFAPMERFESDEEEEDEEEEDEEEEDKEKSSDSSYLKTTMIIGGVSFPTKNTL